MSARFAAAVLAASCWVGVPGAATAQVRPIVQKAGARQPTMVHAVVEDATGRQEMYAVRSSLRQLVSAQETYWRSRKTYATDVSALTTYQPTPGVMVQIVRARADGWAARANYDAGSGGRSCVIWVGDIPASERPLTDAERKSYPEAEVSCDGDGYTARGEWAAAGHSYMTYALNKLTRSEARFYAFHQRYTGESAALDPFIWDSDVTVTITSATHAGWAARATFTGSPGKSCVIWHGTLDAKQVPATVAQHVTSADDVVACDEVM
jgi:hypothetical protein